MEIIPALESLYGFPITPYGQGSEARTFRGGGKVFKVFNPKQSNTALREARNMNRAGLGEWVSEHFLLQGYGVLVMREFEGAPMRTLPSERDIAFIGRFFDQLHQSKEPGSTNRDVLEYRLELFQEWLRDVPEAIDLAKEIAVRLDELVGVPLSFCHKDPHAGNVLIRAAELGEDVLPPALVIDWARAAGEDPARDLAIFKTGSLDQFSESDSRRLLRVVLDQHQGRQALAARLGLWVPLTYLHDLYWFKRNEPSGFEAALKEKLPRAVAFYSDSRGPKNPLA